MLLGQFQKQFTGHGFSFWPLFPESSGGCGSPFLELFARHLDVFAIDVEAKETADPALLGGEGGMADAEERIEHHQVAEQISHSTLATRSQHS